MSTLQIVDALGVSKYLNGRGIGTIASPFSPIQEVNF